MVIDLLKIVCNVCTRNNLKYHYLGVNIFLHGNNKIYAADFQSDADVLFLSISVCCKFLKILK